MKLRRAYKKEIDGLTKDQRFRLKNVEAYRSRKAAYARTPEERAKRTVYMRSWRAKNRERHNELARQSHQRNKHKHIAKAREYHLKIKFNISPEQYNEMLSRQGFCCAICCKQQSQEKRRFHVDHCHKTGRIRAILCAVCNSHLGWYEKRKENIDKYLDTIW